MDLNRFKKIESAQNSTVKLIRSLKLKKNRLKENLFIADGIKPVTECIKAGFVKQIIVDESRLDKLNKVKELNAVWKSSGQSAHYLLKGSFLYELSKYLHGHEHLDDQQLFDDQSGQAATELGRGHQDD